MKASPRQNAKRELVTNLRRALESLAPYVQHQPRCDSTKGAATPCTCGLAELTGRASRFCTPNTIPAHYTPRKFG
jgi:hypothetical protein